MKIRPVGAELFHADKWTDRHDEARAPKNRYKMQFSGCLLDPQLILTGFEIKNWYKLLISKIISRVRTNPQLQ